VRIFRIADKDADKKLSDREFSELQSQVFNQETSPREIKALKEVLKDEVRK